MIEWEEEVAAVSASFKKAMDGFNASTAKETTGNYGKQASKPASPPSLPPFLVLNDIGISTAKAKIENLERETR